MGLQSFVRWFLPREDHFYDFIEQQAAIAFEAAVALDSFSKATGNENPYREPGKNGAPDVEITAGSVRAAVQDAEHRGDKLVHAMEEALAKTFVTPIDREDLQRLSSELDDICDSANAAARACSLFGIDRPTKPMVELMRKIVECTDVLNRSIPRLRKHEYAQVIDEVRTMRDIEKSADRIYRDAISNLFRDPSVDAKQLLREREVLQNLEKAIDRCEHVADTLTNLAIKNG